MIEPSLPALLARPKIPTIRGMEEGACNLVPFVVLGVLPRLGLFFTLLF